MFVLKKNYKDDEFGRFSRYVVLVIMSHGAGGENSFRVNVWTR